jgi:hypothetical protein
VNTYRITQDGELIESQTPAVVLAHQAAAHCDTHAHYVAECWHCRQAEITAWLAAGCPPLP